MLHYTDEAQLGRSSCLLQAPIYFALCFHVTLDLNVCLTVAYTHEGISLFEVDSKEHVRNFEDVDALSVFQYRETIKGQPPAFLQCGGFVYPLVPGKSPILKTSDKVYMFPELRNNGKNTWGGGESKRVRVRERERERECVCV